MSWRKCLASKTSGFILAPRKLPGIALEKQGRIHKRKKAFIKSQFLSSIWFNNVYNTGPHTSKMSSLYLVTLLYTYIYKLIWREGICTLWQEHKRKIKIPQLLSIPNVPFRSSRIAFVYSIFWWLSSSKILTEISIPQMAFCYCCRCYYFGTWNPGPSPRSECVSGSPNAGNRSVSWVTCQAPNLHYTKSIKAGIMRSLLNMTSDIILKYKWPNSSQDYFLVLVPLVSDSPL